MNFRDEITKMNSDKLTIADVDSFVPEILKIAAMLIYKKINAIEEKIFYRIFYISIISHLVPFVKMFYNNYRQTPT